MRKSYNTWEGLLSAIKPSLAELIKVVEVLPFKCSGPLVKTDASKIWLLDDEDTGGAQTKPPPQRVIKVLRNTLADMSIEAIVHNHTDDVLLLETREEHTNVHGQE